MSGPLVHRNMSATARSMRDLINHMEDGGLLLNPPYRRGDVWSTTQRVNLIRSLLLGVPVAALVLNRRGGNAAWRRNQGDPGATYYAVIDGKQRLTTMIMWWGGEFSIPLEWLESAMVSPEVAGSLITAQDLTPYGRRYMDSVCVIPVAEATLGSLAEEAEVYGLINSAGSMQTEADMARARSFAGGES